MILDRLRGKKKETGSPIARSDFLSVRPVRNPKLKWEKDESGKITLILQMREQPKDNEEKDERRRRRPMFSSSTPSVRTKKIRLDTVGSIVWELCDGERTVKDIAEQLHEKYKMLPSEAEISLNTYFNELAKRGLTAFIVPKEVITRLSGKETEEEKKQQEKEPS
jgi:hypothetical protein